MTFSLWNCEKWNFLGLRPLTPAPIPPFLNTHTHTHTQSSPSSLERIKKMKQTCIFCMHNTYCSCWFQQGDSCRAALSTAFSENRLATRFCACPDHQLVYLLPQPPLPYSHPAKTGKWVLAFMTDLLQWLRAVT